MERKNKIIMAALFFLQLQNAYAIEMITNTAKQTIQTFTSAVAEKPLSLDFQQISIRSALQQIAEFAGINMIISDAVTGNMSIHLTRVTWQQALNLILTTQGLAKQQQGNVLIIAPQKEFDLQVEQQLAAQDKIQDLEPLQSMIIPINFGNAQDLAKLLKSNNNDLLSSRGSVGFDNRTNSLWVEDTSQKLMQIKKLVHKLDIPVKQLLIEARIVSVDKSFERQLGVRFHGRFDNTNGNNPNEGMGVDLPTLGSAMSTGTALAVVKLSKHILLDLELAAMENEGEGNIIASPSLMTANQKEAVIEAGEEIPYQEMASLGATAVAFKKAMLSLRVKPQITPDGHILLDLKVNQDKRGPEVIAGIPTVDTREIQTQVLVKNGETIVLGGIYQKNNHSNMERVPFLGNLPLIGHLFRYKHIQRDQRELLIFVTPKIISDIASYHATLSQ